MAESKKTTKSTKAQETKVEGATTVEETVNGQPTLVEEAKPAKSKKLTKMSQDAQDNRKIAWLAYILFFIPLLINKNSAFVRHHANEGLEINIFDAIAAVLLIVGAVVTSSVAWVQLLMIIFTVIGFGLFVLTITTKIYMIFSSINGKTVSTPWMWDIKIIK